MKKNDLLSKENIKNFSKILSYIFTSRKLVFFIVFVSICLSSFATIASSVFLRSLIDDYIVPMTKVSNPDFSALGLAVSKLAIVFLVGTFAYYFYNRIMADISQNTIKELRDATFNHLQKLPISFFDSRPHGDIMSIFTNDIDILNDFISTGLTTLTSSVLTVIAIFITMLLTSPLLTGVIVIYLLIIIFIVGNIGGKSSRFFQKQQQSIADTNGFIEEMIHGVKIIKVFSHEKQITETFREYNDTLYKNTYLANIYSLLLFPIIFNVSNLIYAVIAIIGGYIAVVHKSITLGEIAAFLQLTKAISGPLNRFSQQINLMVQGLAGVGRIFDLLEEEEEMDNGTVVLRRACFIDNKLTPCQEKTGIWAWERPNGELVELKGDIRFENVDFSYTPGQPILKDISLYAKSGQKIAFVGETGAGKTTITNLINRFYEIDKGVITYDGINIKDIKKKDLRNSIGLVLQDTNLFTDTIFNNLRFGNPHATDEEIIEAAKRTGSHYFINLLPKGYNTVLSGTTSELSEGQKQLLSITRAEISDPPVMIMDEATSSIDSRTEEIVQKSMDLLMEGRTVFVIAHRLSTVRDSNAIMVLSDGRIIERGDHKSLLAEKGLYYHFYTGKAAEKK